MVDRHFGWDEISEGLILLGIQKTDDDQTKRYTRNIKEPETSGIYCPHLYLVLTFHETLGPSKQIQFKKQYMRKSVPNERDVVLLQDIKDLVLFLLSTPVSLQFIKFFHLRITDRFLRALIIYFQYYIKIWEELMEEHAATLKKAPNPLARGNRSQYTSNLHSLRCILAREYADLLLGCQDDIRYHHLKAGKKKNSIVTQSQSEKDLRIFEVLIAMSHRVVWIALQRKHLNLIELELHRLFKTKAYSMAERRGGSQVMKDMLQSDIDVLHGPKIQSKRKLLRNSPLIYELMQSDCDYRILTLEEQDESDDSDPGLIYLRNALFAEEEQLNDLKIKVGILGKDRADFDVMLIPRDEEKSKKIEKNDVANKLTYAKERSSLRNILSSDSEEIEEIKKAAFLTSNIEPATEFLWKTRDRVSNKYVKLNEESKRKWIAREIHRPEISQYDTYSTTTTLD